jgi:hypothetical protein
VGPRASLDVVARRITVVVTKRKDTNLTQFLVKPSLNNERLFCVSGVNIKCETELTEIKM